MARVPAAYRETLELHRKRLLRVSEQRGVRALKKLYEQAQAELERKLARLAASAPGTFSAHQHRMFLGQIRQGVQVLLKRMQGGLGDISRDAQVEALRGLLGDIGRLEKKFTGADIVLPTEEAGRFQGVISGRRESLLRSHESSTASYGGRLIRKMEDDLSLSLITGETTTDTVGRIMNTVGNEWWQAERIARTETAWAFNATQRDGLQDVTDELPDMMMRWVELVDDATLMPLDDRVDEDSVAMHGQVTAPGGLFYFPNTMPDGTPLPARLERFRGDSWANPPNRPNDRATIAPWRPHWGVPAWRWNGRRVPIRVRTR